MSDASVQPPASGNLFTGATFTALGALNLLHSWYLFDQRDVIEDGFGIGQTLDGQEGFALLADRIELWAWIYLAFGLLQVATGIKQGLSGGWAVAGVALATVSLIAWFPMLFIQPMAGLIGTVLAFTLIWSITLHTARG